MRIASTQSLDEQTGNEKPPRLTLPLPDACNNVITRNPRAPDAPVRPVEVTQSAITLRREAGPTPAGLRRVGVVKCETPGVQTVVIIDGRTHQIQAVSFVHKDGNPVDGKL